MDMSCLVNSIALPICYTITKKILTLVPTPISPPGTAYIKSFCSANNDTILDRIGLQVNFPSESLDTRPGRTSISCPTLRTPKIVR